MSHYLPTGKGDGDLNVTTVKNLRSESHVELKQANREFNDCLSNIFMPKWLAGEKI